ncbi:hypothetical protein SDC9_89701 [bioreactor metagenome]|uniref:Uncharacterized protein n=1 Tax=bioreactor metagenome TaxID=1076179 RepID=A0A644ZPX4_9ZZZZ
MIRVDIDIGRRYQRPVKGVVGEGVVARFCYTQRIVVIIRHSADGQYVAVGDIGSVYYRRGSSRCCGVCNCEIACDQPNIRHGDFNSGRGGRISADIHVGYDHACDAHIVKSTCRQRHRWQETYSHCKC